MPFERRDRGDPGPLTGDIRTLSTEDAENPAFWRETMPAAFRLENLAVSAGVDESARVDSFERNIVGQPVALRVDPDFDPLSEDNLEGYERDAERFAAVFTPEQSDALKADLDREYADRETIRRSGAAGFVAMLGAGVLDPTVLVPAGGQVRAGESLLRVGLRTAAAAGGATVVQEVGLQESQELRTTPESAFNVAGATLLGGVLGAGTGALVNKARAGREVEDMMRIPADDEPDAFNPMEAVPVRARTETAEAALNATGDGAARSADEIISLTEEARSVGAEGVWRPTLSQQAIDTAVARTIVNVSKRVPGLSSDPLQRTMTSPSLNTRLAIEDLADIPSALVKNGARVEMRTLPDGTRQRQIVWGQPTRQSVESNVGRYDSLLGRAVTGVDDAYIRYLRGRERLPGDIFLSGLQNVTGLRGRGRMARPDFQREVIRAARRGDKHEIPEVQAAAEQLRREFFNPLKEAAREQGFFGYDIVRDPENPDAPGRIVMRDPDVSETAESYVPRVYNREKIERRRSEFVNQLYEHFVEERARAQARVGELESEVARVEEEGRQALREAREAIIARNRQLRESRRRVRRAETSERAAQARLREAEAQERQAAGRADTTAPRDLPPGERAYWDGLRKEVVRGRGEDRPVSLSEWVIAQGGIRDPETMLPVEQLNRPGLINRRTPKAPGADVDVNGQPVGKPMDLLREAAVEEGYIDEAADLNVFADRVLDDINGRKVYSEVDREAVAHMEYLEALRTELARDGLSADNMNAEDFAAWYSGQDFAKSTAFQRGLANEARLREEQSGRRLRRAQDLREDVEFDTADARAVARTMRETAPELTARANELRKQHRAARAELARLRKELGEQQARAEKIDDELLADANNTTDRILSGPEGRIGGDEAGSKKKFRGVDRSDEIVGLSGRFKNRGLTMRDEALEPWLESDLNHLARVTVRSIAPDVELVKRFGSVDMELPLRQVVEEFDRLAAKAETERAAQQLQREKGRAVRDLMGVRDRIRGVYGVPSNPHSVAERAARNVVVVNYGRLMGGVTIASLPDAPRALFTHGLGRALGPAVSALTGNFKAIKGMDAELRAAGPGFEQVLNNRALSMVDLLDDYGRHTKIERMMTTFQSHFGYASLITPWNRTMKGIAGYAVQNRVMRAALNTLRGKATKRDAEIMTGLGIGEADAKNIARQFERHGERSMGNLIARSDRWDAPALRDMWLNAIRKEVNRLIVTPGQDKPLFANTSLGRVIMQFRSYNFAATQRVLVAYAQGLISGRDAHVAMALVTQIGIGMVVAKIKAEQYGLDTSDWDSRKWIVEGVDRSGVLGAMTDINMMIEKGSGGALGLSALAGEGRLSRYQTRNLAGAVLGPSFGAAQDAAFGVSGVVSEGVDQLTGRDESELSRSQIRALRRLLPFQNLFYIRTIFDKIENAAGDAAGAEGERLDNG